MSRLGLTEKQQAAFDAILTYQAAHGKAPTYGEIAAQIGVASKSGVNRLVLALEERGYIARLPKRTRSIAVIDAGAAPSLGFKPQLQARLEAFCRIRGERPADVIADAVALFLDEEEGAVAA